MFANPRAALALCLSPFLALAATAPPAAAQLRVERVELLQTIPREAIRSAEAVEDGQGRWAVDIRLAPAAARAFAEVTRNNIGRRIQLAIGDQILSSPRIAAPILTGALRLTGPETRAEAQAIVDALR